MNAAHLHIALVHIPVVLVPVGAIILAVAIKWNQGILVKTANSIFIAAAAVGIFAFQLGEGAEELVEHVSGVLESNIEAHEEAGEFALWGLIILGLGALFATIPNPFYARSERLVQMIILVVAIISSASLAVTAQQGGKIRHPEAFNEIKN